MILGILSEAAVVASQKPVAAGQQYSAQQSTCPARSVNYITQSLPQQCLAKSWQHQGSSKKTSNSLLPDENDINKSAYIDTELITVTATLVTQPNSSLSFAETEASAPTQTDVSLPATSTSTHSPYQTTSAPTDEPDADNDSPLDNENFLSFEEWKRRNLVKVGQSPEHVGNRGGQEDGGTRHRPGGISSALDSLGEDTEIEIDFGGFGSSGAVVGANDPDADQSKDKVHETLQDGSSHRSHSRGKDAGKTCKERFNHASFDCAATVLKTNPECKGSTSVLVENKDSYLLNKCSAKNQFFIVELCNDILVDTIVLANFEFFSSMFRTFRVSVSDRYPVKLDKWRELGSFEARNSRQVQAFLVEDPQIWARYLRIEFLTHYGNEYYCPVSLLRVHGTTMMEEFNHDVKGSRTEDEMEPDIAESGTEDGKVFDVVTAENLKTASTSKVQNQTDQTSLTNTASENPTPLPTPKAEDVMPTPAMQMTANVHTSPNLLLRNRMQLMFLSNLTCSPASSEFVTFSSFTEKPSATTQTTTEKSSLIRQSDPASIPPVVSRTTQTSRPAESGGQSTTLAKPTKSTEPASKTSVDSPIQSNAATSPSSPSTSQSSTPASRASTSATGPPPSNPTTQESFFKSVHKRLQLLEANSTLSLQYIEEQSRILRDAFAKVEKRQLAKTSAFLESLNTTVLTEIRDFRNQYDQLWQSTVLELSSQRAHSQQEIVALSSRLTVLADEVVFQKRMAILQFLLILVCLGLVLFSRSSSSTATLLELPPVVQNAWNKSSTSLSRYAPHLDTPPASPSSTRPPSRYDSSGRDFTSHRRGLSEYSAISTDEGRKSPDVTPPTPTSQHSSDIGNLNVAAEHNHDESLDGELDKRQIKSSPSTPLGLRDGQKNSIDNDYLRPG